MTDVNDFIIDVENTAKKILRESNRRHLEETRQEQLKESRRIKLEQKKQSDKLKGIITIQERDTFNSLNEIKEKIFNVPVGAVAVTLNEKKEKKRNHLNDIDDMNISDGLIKTKVLSYSIPKMTIGLGGETVNYHDDPFNSPTFKSSGGIGTKTFGLKSSQLSPIQTRPTSSSKKNKSMSLSLEQEKVMKQSALLKKLETSPFQPSAETVARELGKGNKPVKQTPSKSDQKPIQETDWSLRQHAAGILSGKVNAVSSSNANKIFQQSLLPSSSTRSEAQGPIDWSSRGLYIKYRSVNERELAWTTYMDAMNYVDTTVYSEEKQLIPVTAITRHPVMALYYDYLTKENILSRKKTLARLKMKRFVQNIHEIWLTNLIHLKEHQNEEGNIFRKYGYPPSSGQGSGNGSGYGNSRSGSTANSEGDEAGGYHGPGGSSHGTTSGSGTGLGSNQVPRGKGLKDRRDTDAILNMSSQVQSVSHHRAMKDSYYTTRMGEPQVRLDYVITPCPKHDITSLLPPPPYLQPLCQQSHGFETEPSRHSFVISIDRLIPPNSQDASLLHSTFPKLYIPQSKPISNSLWRISVIRTNHHLLSKAFLVPEYQINDLMTQLQSDWKQLQSNDPEDAEDEEGLFDECLFELSDLDIVWGNNIDLNCSVKVSIRSNGIQSLGSLSPLNHLSNTILIVIAAQFRLDYVGIPITPLVLNPIEFCTLLGIQQLPSINESLADWFRASLDPEETHYSIWERFTSQIYFMEGYEDPETGDPLPTHLGLRSYEEDFAKKYQEQNSNQQEVPAPQSQPSTPLSSVLPSSIAISQAYLLLSLLRVTDELDISLDNIHIPASSSPVSIERKGPSTSDKENLNIESEDPPQRILHVLEPLFISTAQHYLFEELSDVINNLSLRVSGGELLLKQIPGAAAVGSMGIWHKYPLHRERTQASAIYYRNPQISSTDSVLVNLTLALDTSVLISPILSWEPHSEYPPATIPDPIDGIVPMIVVYPKTLLSEEFVSMFDKQTTPIVHIFNTTPLEGVDYPDTEPYRLKKKRNPKGFTRHLPLRSDNGFRNQIVENLLATDPSLPTIVFGITRLGAIPNATAVHTRSIWHSCIAVTEGVNRIRGAVDYHYVLHNELSRGPNDPACFTLRFFGYGNKDTFRADVVCSAFESMEKQYMEIQEERDIFARENSLAAKIEASEIILKTKQKQFELLMRKRTQASIEKRMRKASKTERGWRRKFEFSVLVAQQGNWEQRLDQRAGIYFFHRLGEDPEIEVLSETCQWEVPVAWAGDLLLTPANQNDTKDLEEAFNPNISVNPNSRDPAFSQPSEVWLPHDEGIKSSKHSDDDQTPGIKATGVIRSGQNKGGSRVGTGGNSLVGFSSSISKHSKEEETQLKGNPSTTASGVAEELLLNDDLVYALAKRLGLSTEKIVPVSQLPSVFTMSQDESLSQPGNQFQPFSSMQSNSIEGPSGLLAPRLDSIDEINDVEDPKYDTDDEMWSDDERLVGDVNDEHEEIESFLPQNHKDVKKFQQIQNELLGNTGMDPTKSKKSPSKRGSSRVPELNINQKVHNGQDPHAMNQGVVGWRKLPRPEIPAKFFQKCVQTRTLGPDVQSLANKPNNPIYLIPLSPVDACQYEPMTFSVDIESIFIPDARKDMDRVLANIERNIEREEQLSKNIPTDELLLFGKAEAMTSVDSFVANQYKQDKELNRDPKQEAIEKAILAAKTSNLSEMEDALEEDISIDTQDQFGNTLLILAAQQGSKRMCKYLLRRGANMNAQSLTGQTALHYCYAYSHHELGEYLKSRGANDSILNAEKLTCYEGLSTQGAAAIV